MSLAVLRTMALRALLYALGVAIVIGSQIFVFRYLAQLAGRHAAPVIADNLSEVCLFDIDRARNDYARDVRWAFQFGCDIGVDYPPEFREPVVGFNPNSPVVYCNDKFVDRMVPILEQDVAKFGRRDSK